MSSVTIGLGLRIIGILQTPQSPFAQFGNLFETREFRIWFYLLGPALLAWLLITRAGPAIAHRRGPSSKLRWLARFSPDSINTGVKILLFVLFSVFFWWALVWLYYTSAGSLPTGHQPIPDRPGSWNMIWPLLFIPLAMLIGYFMVWPRKKDEVKDRYFIDTSSLLRPGHPLQQIESEVQQVIRKLGDRIDKAEADDSPVKFPGGIRGILRANVIGRLYRIPDPVGLYEQIHVNLAFRRFLGLAPDQALGGETRFCKDYEHSKPYIAEFDQRLDKVVSFFQRSRSRFLPGFYYLDEAGLRRTGHPLADIETHVSETLENMRRGIDEVDRASESEQYRFPGGARALLRASVVVKLYRIGSFEGLFDQLHANVAFRRFIGLAPEESFGDEAMLKAGFKRCEKLLREFHGQLNTETAKLMASPYLPHCSRRDGSGGGPSTSPRHELTQYFGELSGRPSRSISNRTVKASSAETVPARSESSPAAAPTAAPSSTAPEAILSNDVVPEKPDPQVAAGPVKQNGSRGVQGPDGASKAPGGEQPKT